MASESNTEIEEKKTSLGFSALDGLMELGVIKQLGLLVGLAASIAVGIGAALWYQEPDFRPLYTDISHLEANQVADLLEQENIRFRVDTSSGILMVEASKIHQARMRLAAEGFPSGNTMGYELLDQEQSFGTSQFMEKTRYYRSIEGELARTVASMNSIRNARVHLAIPKRSVFVNDSRKPSASVFVEIYPNQSLNRMQVASIVNLVASSVPELDEKQVTVVDQRGKLLSETDADSDIVMAAKQLEYVEQIENLYMRRIENILQPILGLERFKVQVSADVDFNRTEQTSEFFDPDLPAVRSEQTLSEVVGGKGAIGVPGALTNQPPGAAALPEVAEGGEATAVESGNVRKQATRNFELDRTISHTKHATGGVKRLTVAVVVDDKMVPPAPDAEIQEPQRVAITQDELDRLTLLVRDAIGYNLSRGDSVSVINQSFERIEPNLDFPEPKLWEQPGFWDKVEKGIGFLVVLFLFFGVLRPILKSLANNGKADELAALDSQLDPDLLGEDGTLPDGAHVTFSGGTNPLLPGPDSSYDQQLEAVKSMVAEDPRRVAQVIKTWIADE